MRAGRGGTATAYRQPWYPVQERYGLVFAYMGPPERKPLLPRYDALEVLDPGDSWSRTTTASAGAGPLMHLQLVPALTRT